MNFDNSSTGMLCRANLSCVEMSFNKGRLNEINDVVVQLHKIIFEETCSRNELKTANSALEAEVESLKAALARAHSLLAKAETALTAVAHVDAALDAALAAAKSSNA